VLLDCISKVELHAVKRHFSAAIAAAGGKANAHSVSVQAPLAVADALAEWQLGVEQALVSGTLRLAPAPGEEHTSGGAQSALLARLKSVRDAWAAEEAAWQALEAQADAEQQEGAALPGDDDVARMQQQADAAAAAVARVASATAVGALASAVEEAQQRLQLQLADMAAAVDGAQALASRGESACAQLTAVMAATEMADLGVPADVADSPRQLMRALVPV
jgi:hypothetical protein